MQRTRTRSPASYVPPCQHGTPDRATLDVLSGGRVVLGVGTGHLKPEFLSLGVAHGSRAEISEEALPAVATALEHRPWFGDAVERRLAVTVGQR